MKGHQARVCRVAFHPSGDYVASASFDTTWRLWDVNTSKELLLQEGHSKEVYSVEFQHDGALAASGWVCNFKSMQAKLTVRWSGDSTRSVVSGICVQEDLPWFSMDTFRQYFRLGFHPMGSDVFSSYRVNIYSRFLFILVFVRYQIATGAGDDTIRIWDMRSLKAIYTIPAHLSNVSDIRFFYANDLYFKPSPPASDVVMNGADIDDDSSHDTPDSTDANNFMEEWRYRSGLFFASSGYDGFVKLWSADDWQLLRTLSTDAGKVMSVDISSDGNLLASGTYNRNFQLFAPEDV